jgi:ADP-heptose:LPS heptosyltransferase
MGCVAALLTFSNLYLNCKRLAKGHFVQRVGWIRIGALGDLLVGLASLRETLDKWPQANVTVIGSSLWLQILEPGYWPQIDRIAVVEKRGNIALIHDRVDGIWVARASFTLTLKNELQSGYSAVVNTRVDSPRQGFAAFWARVPERWGAAAGAARFIYNRRGHHDGKDPLIHERDVPLLVMDEAEAFENGQHDFSGKTLSERIAVSARIRKWRGSGLPAPRRLDSSIVKQSIGSDRYFIVNPTSSRREKAWPSNRFRALLTEVEKRAFFSGVKPIVVGSKAETEWLREVAGENFLIVQPPSIGDLFDVVSGAEFLVTNTSSVQFIAASVGTKTLTLMGRARPEIWGPLGPSDRFLMGKEPLEIASMFERELKAYESIEVETVLQALVSMGPAHA